jgi:hypothetical protein
MTSKAHKTVLDTFLSQKTPMKSLTDFMNESHHQDKRRLHTTHKHGFLVRIELHGGADYPRVREELAKRGIQAIISAPHAGSFKLVPTTYYYDGSNKEITAERIHNMVKEAISAALEPGEPPQDASVIVAKTDTVVWSGLEQE